MGVGDYIDQLQMQRSGGFNFDNCRRNVLIEEELLRSRTVGGGGGGGSSSSHHLAAGTGNSANDNSHTNITTGGGGGGGLGGGVGVGVGSGDIDPTLSDYSTASTAARCFLAGPRKTGTTICGVLCRDAVVLASDTRATQDAIVADKNCSKLHRIADNIYCAGAGTSADLEHTTEWVAARMELHRLNTHTQPRVGMVVSVLSQELFKYMGYKGCALVLGGVDITGPSLYKVNPHGSTDRSPFATMGSGSLNAMAILEQGFKDNMSITEGKKLVVEAIRAGVFNDLGSGGNIDVCVITKEGKAEHIRPMEEPNPRTFRLPQPVRFPFGTTPVLRRKVEELKSRIIVEPMDTVEAENEA